MAKRPEAGDPGPEVLRDDSALPTPKSGGCWVTDPLTGTMTPAPTEPAAPAAEQEPPK
jgi:hypothetical protein